jgi:hypothetical protein
VSAWGTSARRHDRLLKGLGTALAHDCQTAHLNGVYVPEMAVNSVGSYRVDLGKNLDNDIRYRCAKAPAKVGAFRFRCSFVEFMESDVLSHYASSRDE